MEFSEGAVREPPLQSKQPSPPAGEGGAEHRVRGSTRHSIRRDSVVSVYRYGFPQPPPPGVSILNTDACGAWNAPLLGKT